MKKQSTRERRTVVSIRPETHARLKSVAQSTGMKIEALADKYVSAGLMYDYRESNASEAKS